MSYRTARTLQIVLMLWLTTTFLTAWLPFLRSAFDGPSYQWGAALFGVQFGGTGLAGDYWFVAAKAALALGLLFAGWRRPNGVFRPVLVAWLALMLADTVYNVATAPEAFRFRGDTLGIDISLVGLATGLDSAMLLLACWFMAKAPALPVPPLAGANRALACTAIALLPLQYVLLSGSSGQESGDVAGVLLTIAGWYLFSAGLGLWRSPRAARGSRLQHS
jgi:hypothetical protein